MKLVVGLVVAALVEYLCMVLWWNVPTYWPVVLTHLVVFLGIITIVSGIWDSTEGYRAKASTTTVLSGTLAALFLVLIILVAFLRSAAFNAGGFHDLGQVKVVDKPLEVADISHIRLVPKESAEWIGNQMIGKNNLGSLFEPGEYEIQRVRGTLYWVSPLVFRGWWSWRAAGYTSPGYIMVSAEDLNAPPKMMTNYKMKYTWGAYWGNNLHRRLYFSGLSGYSLYEITFEIDEAGKPYYVASLTQPQIGFNGPKVMAVAILDPETGEMKKYNSAANKSGGYDYFDGQEKMPGWVDRAFPEMVAEAYADWWGGYVYGWWNRGLGQRGVQIISPTPEPKEGKSTITDVFLVQNAETKHPIWIAGMTSPSTKDTALTGYMTADSITGRMVFYRVTSAGNEQAAITTTEGAPEVAIKKNYHAAQPILNNLYGADSWVVPVLSPTHIVEMVAIIYAKDSRHVAVGNSKEEALERYKDLLASIKAPGVVPTGTKLVASILRGKVLRINEITESGGPRFYLLLDSRPTQMFRVSPEAGDEIYLTQEGDSVELSYYDTSEERVSVKKFDNFALDLVKSKPQREYEAKRTVEARQSRAELERQRQALQKQMEGIKEQMKDTE